jgi:predicted nucleotidyltransferase
MLPGADGPNTHTTWPSAPLVEDRATIERLLSEAVGRIADTLQPEKIILLGSYAYGAPSADSDVDLLVILDRPGTRADRYLAVAEQLRPRLFAVDLLVRTPGEIAQAVAHGDFFIDEILRRGRVLYEQRP